MQNFYATEETETNLIKFKYDDGGRSNYFKGQNVGDCVVRAIAIASGKDYKEVYDELARRMKAYAGKSWSRTAKRMKKEGRTTPRNGVNKQAYEPYLKELGFEWIPTMKIGSGMQVHVREDELPEGTLILRLSRHLTCVKDGVLYDTYDCSREGTRGVYGYWIKK
jgi:hypothetical protein